LGGALALFACGGALEPSGSGGGDDPGGDPPVTDPNAPTFSKEVARLMQEHCDSCHRPDGHAPTSFMTYADVRGYADQIRTAVVTGVMPDGASLRVDTGCSDETMFEGPRRLTETEIDTIVAWVEAGAPEGDPSEMPEPIQYAPETQWQTGTPDLEVLNAPMGFTVPPQLDRDIFRRFAIPTTFGADRYITSFEALPGDGSDVTGIGGRTGIVHHVTLFIDSTGTALEDQQAFAASDPEVPGPGYEGDVAVAPGALVGMWFPGSRPLIMPEGIGIKIPAGATLVIEIHYSTFHTTSVTDRTRIGLHLAPLGATVRERRAVTLRNEEFALPPDSVDYQVKATLTLTAAERLYTVTPHMHLLGTDFLIEVKPPADATDTCVGDFSWNFEHQNTYSLKQPLVLPAGTTVDITCRYDNTAQNPSQFNEPPAEVTAGRASFNEMCQLVMGLVAE
jgi:mono/diheme cytochrome c family protein